MTLLVCLVRCAAAALASSDPAELVWLLAERLEATNKTTHSNEETKSACTALQKLLTKQPNKVRALAAGASAVLTRVLAVYQGHPDLKSAYTAAVSAWLALTLTPDQRTLPDAGNPPCISLLMLLLRLLLLLLL